MRIVLFKRDLAEQNVLLRRIAEALERMMPALRAHEPPPYKADLSDLRIVNAAELRELDDLKKEFALMWNVVPDSEAWDNAVKEFEDLVRAGQGQQAVDELLWNRIGRQKS
jgi:hypothetical protein